MRGFKDSLTAGLAETVFDDATGGLGGGLTGLCNVLGILGGGGAGVVGFFWLIVVNPLVAKPLAALPDEMVTGALAGSSVSSDSFLFLLVPCSETATACGRNSWEKMQ
jgi:hypothetical protein